MRASPWAGLLVCSIAVAIAVIDPGREFLSQDDGWAYARSVQQLLATGHYQLDAWSAANNPVQIYLAAGLSKVLGFSLAILRLPTLLLLCCGLAAFVALLRELAVGRAAAVILALVLFANPLVLMLSFTFMSDVQFMGWLLLALWLYVRGFARGHLLSLLLGSVAAACAIGTRQFGVALVIGAFAAWCLPGRPWRSPPLHLAVALALPLLVTIWQVQAGLAEPNFTQAARLREQAAFLAVGGPGLLKEIGWRLGTVAQYLGLLMLPLFPAFAQLLAQRWKELALRHSVPVRIGVAGAGLALVAALLVLSRLPSPTARDPFDRVLPLPWLLPTAAWEHPDLMRTAAVLGLLGAVLLVAVAVTGRFRSRSASSTATQGWRIVAAVGLSLLGMHVSYVQLNDTYLVGLLPFALLVPGRFLGEVRAARTWPIAAGAASLAVVVVVSFWMRGDYNRQQAQWRAADELVSAGGDRRCIGAPRHWAEYHGIFDDWIAAGHPGYVVPPSEQSSVAVVPPPLHEPFYAWSNKRYWYAVARIAHPWETVVAEGWALAGETSYRDAFFERQTVRTLQRLHDRPADAEPCTRAP